MDSRIHIKPEPQDDEMAIDPCPPTFSQKHLFDPPHMTAASSSTSSMKMDIFSDNIGGIPITMKLKPVGQWLEDGPQLPNKVSKPPARPIPQQTFSSLPTTIKQDPKDPTRVVGERATTSYVSELYEYIQGHCPKHSVEGFSFEEPHQQQFTVVLNLQGLPPITPPFDRKGDDEVETPMLFHSKKAAKEKVAQIALEELKKIPTEPEHIFIGPGKVKGESPMGELNRYCSQNALSRPHVLDTSNSKPPYFFGCEITIDINGKQTFGDPNPNHPNKTSARNAAAQEALKWIARENPKIIKIKGKAGKSSRVLAPGSFVQIDASEKTIGEVATEACALLGFKAPQRELLPVPDRQGMYNVYVTIEHADKVTRVGPRKNIFGQKAASKAAMGLTLQTVQYLAESMYQVKLEIIGRIEFEIE